MPRGLSREKQRGGARGLLPAQHGARAAAASATARCPECRTGAPAEMGEWRTPPVGNRGGKTPSGRLVAPS